MATTSPRIHTVLPPTAFRAVRDLAREHGKSLSQEAGDLIREALEFHEDRALEALAEPRRRTWDSAKSLTAAQVAARARSR